MIPNNIQSQFPILDTQVHGHPLVYLDNAATTQKPQSVIEALDDYYRTLNSNIHRGAHHLAAAATERYEAVRRQVQHLINARHSHEIVFTRGTTESINLVASSFSKRYFTGDDEVIVSGMEHHSDIPVAEIIRIAHNHGVPVLIDGAQSISHLKVDVQALGCDFYCFSGHKMYGPMGVGVMYGREEILNELPPYQGGGEMIENVTFERTTYNQLPFKFEAGTPSVGDVIGLGVAIDFMQEVGVDNIAAHEDDLLRYATEGLSRIPGVRIFGTAPQKTSVLSFLVGDAHPYDIGTLLDQLGIAVRTGHHCTQPILDRYHIPGTVRASFAVYNTREEVEVFLKALERVLPLLG